MKKYNLILIFLRIDISSSKCKVIVKIKQWWKHKIGDFRVWMIKYWVKGTCFVHLLFVILIWISTFLFGSSDMGKSPILCLCMHILYYDLKFKLLFNGFTNVKCQSWFYCLRVKVYVRKIIISVIKYLLSCTITHM